MKNYQFPIVIEKDRDGYAAFCPALQGCYAQGENYEEVLANIHDVVKLHLADRLDNNEEISEARAFSLASVEVAV